MKTVDGTLFMFYRETTNQVIAGFRDPARILATGASSARDVSVADGDIYVAGTPRKSAIGVPLP